MPAPLRVVLLTATLAFAACEGAQSVVAKRPDGAPDRAPIDLPEAADVPLPEDVDAGAFSDRAEPFDLASGCRSDNDCVWAGLRVCEHLTGRCAECLPSIDDCAAGTYCDPTAYRCVAGCRNDDGCAMVDAGPRDGGPAVTLRCDTRTHACVECDDDDDCPPSRVCSGARCVPGCSMAHPCMPPEMCCDGACADLGMSLDHCGTCGNACRPAHGTAMCTGSRCAVVACEEGYGDCDRNGSNGCETELRANLAHCGSCTRSCSMFNATPTCVMGVCTIVRCNTGTGDCDLSTENGCETDLADTVEHCGVCGRRCNLPRARSGCARGACTVESCDEGYRDCDMDASNGCETAINTDAHCGGCDVVCEAGTRCAGGACVSVRDS